MDLVRLGHDEDIPPQYYKISTGAQAKTGDIAFCLLKADIQSFKGPVDAQAMHTLKKSIVAVKRIRGRNNGKIDEILAFLRIKKYLSAQEDSMMTQSVRHNIVNLMGLDRKWKEAKDIRNWTWLAMEAIIPGITIEDLFQGQHKLGTTVRKYIPHTFALEFFLQIGQALVFLHEKMNYAHRDIGRENILISIAHPAQCEAENTELCTQHLPIVRYVLVDLEACGRTEDSFRNICNKQDDVFTFCYLVRQLADHGAVEGSDEWIAFLKSMRKFPQHKNIIELMVLWVERVRAMRDEQAEVEKEDVAKVLDFVKEKGGEKECETLNRIFGDDQVDMQSESVYKAFVSAYWSDQQKVMSPKCVFKPQKSLDVSTAILVARLTDCKFAAKSGGHSAVAGGSNIQDGITISFERMNQTTLSADKKSVSYQPGQTWAQVYDKLAKDNVGVLGGRVADVGVGGLTMGGGISFFSSMYGLACDNVISYELVTASGRIINVDKTSYPDLYQCLRGGGNNFGLVTKFTVVAIPRQGNMWGGVRLYPAAVSPAVIKAYYNLGMSATKDPKSHQIVSFGVLPQVGQVSLVQLDYADPTGNASVFSEYNAIPGAIQDSTGINSLSNLTRALGVQPDSGSRQLFRSWTAKLDEDMANTIKNIYFEELPSILNATRILPALALQVLTQPIIEKTHSNGGNVLGLDPKGGPLLLALISISWADSADDERLHQFTARVEKRAVAAAKAKGKHNDYIYMNYGSQYQDVVAGYGSANKARMIAVSHKYDPHGVFQQLQPGYFKLNGAPQLGA
ncbi:FAD binding domain containing protein [Pyrenophora tritici-repentis]|nr:FAD binding domain containing protein [Pyrenophora tritici-repentis]